MTPTPDSPETPTLAERLTLPRWKCRRCGCLWRDNLNGMVSLFDAQQKSCADCERLTDQSTCEIDWFDAVLVAALTPEPPARMTLEETLTLTAKNAAWTLDNIYTLARRALKKTPDDEKWGHVLRLCEQPGCRAAGVLRDDTPAPEPVIPPVAAPPSRPATMEVAIGANGAERDPWAAASSTRSLTLKKELDQLVCNVLGEGPDDHGLCGHCGNKIGGGYTEIRGKRYHPWPCAGGVWHEIAIAAEAALAERTRERDAAQKERDEETRIYWERPNQTGSLVEIPQCDKCERAAIATVFDKATGTDETLCIHHFNLQIAALTEVR